MPIYIFLLTELSLSARNPHNLPSGNRIPHVRFHANQYGQLVRISASHLSEVPKIASADGYVLGVVIEGQIYGLFDANRQWVIVRVRDRQNFAMRGALLAEYGPFFSRTRAHPNMCLLIAAPAAR